jgi:hypothetical protein
MRFRFRLGVALAAVALFGLAAPAEAKALMIAAPQKPSILAAQADVVVIGKVVEVEKDTVEATPFKGAPKEQKQAYKIAVVKIEESIIGGKGLTQFRVGFPEGAAAPRPVPALPGGGGVVGRPLPARVPVVGLSAGQEGCFFLSQHHDGEFYIVASNGMAAPLDKKAKNYDKLLEEVKKVAKAIDDPVAALKSKALEDRFEAAYVILQRYQVNRGNGATREAIPAEENKLIVALLRELPWQPMDTRPRTGSDPVPPSRSAIWYMINPQEQGFKQPKAPPRKAGQPLVNFNKMMDEATTAFLKDNGDKIKIKGYTK